MSQCKIFALGLWLSACAGPMLQLSPEEQRVAIWTALPNDSKYELVGEVRASYGQNFAQPDSNIERCRLALKAQTKRLGGDLVVVTTQAVGAGSCVNCVSMRGNAFRRLKD